MGLRFSHLGLVLHQDRLMDTTHRHSGFLPVGKVESYVAIQPQPGFRVRAESRPRAQQEKFMIGHDFRICRLSSELAGKIRSVEVASLFVACVLILGGDCLSSSDPAKPPQVVAHTGGLSVVVRRNDGTYEIRMGNGGHSVIHARVAAEIDHKWVQSTEYPKHEISQSNFEDALGHGEGITVTSSGLPNFPDLVYTLRLYDGRAFGVIETGLQNHGGNQVPIQSIRSVEAVGNKVVDLGSAPSAERVLSDSFSEDWPPLQIYALGKVPQGMHRAVGSQLIYNRQSKESLFVGAL